MKNYNVLLTLLILTFSMGITQAEDAQDDGELLKCYVKLSNGQFSVVNVWSNKKHELGSMQLSSSGNSVVSIVYVAECQPQNGKFTSGKANRTDKETLR